MLTMEILSENFPVPCDRMTRGIKRLLEQHERISEQKRKAKGQVKVEVRRNINGKKYVRVFRSSNKDNVDKQSNENITVEKSLEGIVEKSVGAQEFNNVSALLLNVLLQIKSKFWLATRSKALTSSGTGDKSLGITL